MMPHQKLCMQAEEAEMAAKTLRSVATVQMRTGLDQQVEEKLQISEHEKVHTK